MTTTPPSASRPSTFRCPGGCRRRITADLVACPACWDRLPYELRQAIRTHYDRDAYAHAEAIAAARQWYRDNPMPAARNIVGQRGPAVFRPRSGRGHRG